MGSPTEFLTLDTSEWPNDAAECLLSDIIETGNRQPQYCLTDHNIQRLKMRLEKYASTDNELLLALNRYLDGRVT
jgi:hypothetical protein